MAQAERLREGYRYSMPSGVNRQGSEVGKLARVTLGCARDADRQTCRSAFTKTDSVLQTENYDQSDPRVAQRVRSNRQDERNSTSSQRRRQTSSNLVRVLKVMRVGHRQGGSVGGVRQASFAKTTS